MRPVTSHRIWIIARDRTSRRGLTLLSIITLKEFTVNDSTAATINFDSGFAVQESLFTTRSDLGSDVNDPLIFKHTSK
jgi:hypothetical protein